MTRPSEWESSHPDVLREWTLRFGVEPSGAALPELASGAVRALSEALDRPGRDREGAAALLAADALLTEAAARAVEEPDPQEALLELLREVVRELHPDVG